MNYESKQKNTQIEFSKTTFYKGLNAAYGKIQVKLELCLSFYDSIYSSSYERLHDGSYDRSYDDYQCDGCFIGLGLFVGMDKMYKVNDIRHFLETLNNLESYYFSKNFIFEPKKMCFGKENSKILEFLINLKARREYRSRINSRANSRTNSGIYNRNNSSKNISNNNNSNDRVSDYEWQEMNINEVILNGDESEKFLNTIWNDINCISFNKQSEEIQFKNDIDIKIDVEKKDEKDASGSFTMIVDYSQYGDFKPVVFNSRYIMFKGKKLIIKLPENKRELFINLFNFRNEENIVRFEIRENEKKVFRKNFLDKYSHELKVSMDNSVKKEITANRLLTRVYFDVAPKGIVSKIEFCYGDKVINPLDDFDANKSFREIDSEGNVISEMKFYGFREYGKLFLLDDAEKIMFLLTDNLKVLKKTCEVYYSEDFKKLNVKSLNDIDLGLNLSEDGSVIHMNINLENISDEELEELLDAINKKKKYYRLRNGSIINLSTVESDKLADLIRSLDINKGNIINSIRCCF